ncbi:MAG: NUDIX hydrolase [Candidatus Omnitrophica bacterium]|nr:NUDIX hydrolase [Candidatus Omnitrophota bacterium]MCM8791308.1 NUDIX hydrolase [Candidatus Omnitrophota bacterium]
MKTIFNGKLLKVYIKKQRLPHGYLATFEMVKHPGASLVVPFLDKNTVILLRQLRPVVGSYIYEFPAGTLAKKESPLSCARREIIEETGYKARKFKLLGRIYPVPGYSTEKIFIYKAEGLEPVKHVPEDDEVIEHKPFTRAQVRRLFRHGMIVDAKTICGLALCGWL